MKIAELFHLRTRTPGNGRRHWAIDAKHAKEQRKMVCNRFTYGYGKGLLPAFPVKVTMTRYGPRELDRQNMPGAMKHVIDGVADAYEIDDKDKRWVFEYEQKKAKQHAVLVEIESV